MEKKINSWWDIVTHEQYIKDKLLPRRLRWDVPISDGLVDKESTDEWFQFFNDKGLELLHLLIKRKQCKVRTLDKKIGELKAIVEISKELPEFETLAKQLQRDMERKDDETAARKRRKYQRDLKDYEDDLVFKWQSKLEETIINSTNTTPEKEEKSLMVTETNKKPPTNGPVDRMNNYNTPNQRQGWNGNNNWKRPFWKNGWQNNVDNHYNSPRPYQYLPDRREPPTPPWRNYDNRGFDNRRGEMRPYYHDGKYDQAPYENRRNFVRPQDYDRKYDPIPYENRRRDTRPQYYDGKHEQAIYENHYNVPTYNRYEHLRRDEEGVRTPRYQYERGRTPRYQHEGRDRTPRRFLEMRRQDSPRRYRTEYGSRRSPRRCPERGVRRDIRREERNQEHRREGEGEKKLKRSPRRDSEKLSGRNEKPNVDAEQELKNRRKRDQ